MALVRIYDFFSKYFLYLSTHVSNYFAGENESWEFTAMFDCMGALSTSYNETHQKASRAFDKNRECFVITGGGRILVLEEL